MNYWYVARANELFIDTDNVSKSIRHTRARLQGAIECGKLDVACVMSRPSKRNDHLHTIITLNKELGEPLERYIWEIVLHGDIYRGCCNLMRYINGVKSPDVLISPHDKFHDPTLRGSVCTDKCRLCDDMCDCESKHNAATMAVCPAAIRLRGENRTRGFFGKPSKDTSKLDALWPIPDLLRRNTQKR